MVNIIITVRLSVNDSLSAAIYNYSQDCEVSARHITYADGSHNDFRIRVIKPLFFLIPRDTGRRKSLITPW